MKKRREREEERKRETQQEEEIKKNNRQGQIQTHVRVDVTCAIPTPHVGVEGRILIGNSIV